MATDEPEKPRKLLTLSLVGTEEELKALWDAIAVQGWRLKYMGSSGSWLGEPVYEVRKKTKSELLAALHGLADSSPP